MDLEGMVAKVKHGTQVTSREESTWFRSRTLNTRKARAAKNSSTGANTAGTPAKPLLNRWMPMYPEEISRSCEMPYETLCGRLFLAGGKSVALCSDCRVPYTICSGGTS